jgi:hypothetical protein
MIKFQWDTMADFAKNLLKKMGAVSASEYENIKKENRDLYYRVYETEHLLRDYCKSKASCWPFIIEPEVKFLRKDLSTSSTKIKFTTRNMVWKLDDHMIQGLGKEKYKKFMARELSYKWAKQTEDILNEILEKIN